MHGGLVALDGNRWDEDCNSCLCHNGRVTCTKVQVRFILVYCLYIICMFMAIVKKTVVVKQIKSHAKYT